MFRAMMAMPPTGPAQLATYCTTATLLLLSSLHAQQDAAVRYELRIVDIATQRAAITATFPTQGKDALELFLPLWSPGFYRAQDYHEDVLDFTARAGTAQASVERPRPNRWRIATGGAAEVVVEYSLRCARGSVTQNQIAEGFAVFCGPATFVGEVGAEPRPHRVHVTLPAGWPTVSTGLPSTPGTAAFDYTARDYDWLLDSPFVLGKITTTSFDVHGARHEWAQFGEPGAWPTAELVPKLQQIAGELCGTFGDVPFERYVFLAGFRRANGGLEHLDSTLLSVDARQSPSDPDFLSFVAHEYAHAFNVKRLRPLELGPFDYEQPPTTPSLWISEGLTTWFGDLALVRTGTLDTKAWLALVADNVRSLQNAAGRKRQTLADASRSVWTGSLSGTGGDPRTTISYYVKGPAVGFVLEARLRVASNGRAGLDALMHAAYARYGGAKGFTPEQFEALAAEFAGSDQQAFFDRALRSCEELDYTEALDWFGLRFAPVAPDAPRSAHWALEVHPEATAAQREHLQALLAPSPAPTRRAAREPERR